MGSEDKGIRMLIKKNCDFVVRIETVIKKDAIVDSLNVSNACAIILNQLTIRMKEIPKYYDNLDLTLEEILGLIQRGVKDRKSGFHNFVLATSSFKNEPDARTVVLRGFDSEKMEISFHSDLRSQKINQLIKNKNVCLVFYDEKKKNSTKNKRKNKYKEVIS